MKFHGGFIVLFFATLVLACTDKYPKAGDETAAVQYFLKACMQGDFERADFYMLKDSENVADLLQMKAAYRQSNRSSRAAYSDAYLIIEDDDAADEHTKILTIKNSYDHIRRKLKAVNINGDWKIDLKYTLSGNL